MITALLPAPALQAREQNAQDVDIADEITELHLVRDSLDDIEIDRLNVSEGDDDKLQGDGEGSGPEDGKKSDPVKTGITFVLTCFILWFAFLRPFFRMLGKIAEANKRSSDSSDGRGNGR